MLLDYNATWAKDKKDMIDAEEGEATTVQADVTNEDGGRDAISTTLEVYGIIDILVNIGRR